MFLLDTNVISELRRPRPSARVRSFIAGQRLEDLFVSTVTFAENLVNAAPQVIDAAVSVSDLDSANFAGGRLDRAEPALRKGLEIDPDGALLLEQMARLEYRQGDFLGARAFLQRRESQIRALTGKNVDADEE